MNSLPPSFSAINYSLILQWIVLFCILYFLYYAAKKIKLEKSSFLEEAKRTDFKKISLLIPLWWEADNNLEQNTLGFHRSDTRYDWSCFFKEISSKKSALSYTDEYLKDQGIILDNSYDSYEKTIKAQYLFKDNSTCNKIADFIRYEATGTQNETDRIYLDIVCFKIKGDEKIYHMESKSSVLNGCVEGPFFEESLKSLIIS